MNDSTKIDTTNISSMMHRIFEIDMELADRSYSQSNPGAMMDRRMLRKEREKLETAINALIHKKRV